MSHFTQCTHYTHNILHYTNYTIHSLFPLQDENKTISLGTSKLNYLDPRISVQWCKTHDVPIEKVNLFMKIVLKSASHCLILLFPS